MNIDRRRLLGSAALGAAAFAMPSVLSAQSDFAGLPNLAKDAKPIGPDELSARLAKAAQLLSKNDIDALLIEPGSSLIYFTGVRWWRSERLTAAVLTREGDLAIVTPFFEEPSVRESLSVPAEALTWNEDENPLAAVATWLGSKGLDKGRVGVEETVRYFAVDALEKAMPEAKVVNGAPVVRGCRMHKSASELALMQVATNITIAAYDYTLSRIAEGMKPGEISAIMNGATSALGGSPEFALVLLNEASAYPHGSDQPQRVKKGGIILMDCGCNVHGYQADVSRTMVFGTASDKQRRVWQQVRKGQDIALDAAKIGTPAGQVDDAVRRYYETLGYGPGYKLPGLSHRTGHGIGLDGHEPVNLVHGEMTRLAPGMCFSNEPGIYIPGEFGVRVEDCFHMSKDGPVWFSRPPETLLELS